ncbi:hypothetical protein PMI01_00459 [Caulobacter sp. AP07]|uniref:hypothetical protein n=1 Tax=Caulobacter sp. AP07 TaxID=1144304 RepID=UPI00027224CF|nr:hypothetical protein [Caulobacter sp. AP07]EJL37871.1 hypothetical protein PMI01_00459 [Caulobacter sp. AP07]
MRPDLDPTDGIDPVGVAPRVRRLARLAFVLSLAPGMVLTMVLAPALQEPRLLLAGLVLIAAAILARHRLVDLFLDWIGARSDSPSPTSISEPRP